jgi:uncharacterized LabA/DUF88 family protein
MATNKEIYMNRSTKVQEKSGNQKEGRTAFIVDIDNLCGSGLAPKQMVEGAVGAIHNRYRPTENDLVYCAATALAAYHCKAIWPGCTVRVGRGQDGSDLRLLKDADPKWLAERFSRVVIASGDGIFATLATDLIGLGVRVEVAVGNGGVSSKLKSLAPVIRLGVGSPTASSIPKNFARSGVLAA